MKKNTFLAILIIFLAASISTASIVQNISEAKQTGTTKSSTKVVEAYTGGEGVRITIEPSTESTTISVEDINYSEWFFDRSVNAWVYASSGSVSIYQYPDENLKPIDLLENTDSLKIVGQYLDDWYIIDYYDGIAFVPYNGGKDLLEKRSFDKYIEETGTLIGSYKTTSSSASDGRTVNLALSSSAASIIVNPGDVFSFNQVVGPRRADLGYKEAHIFVGQNIVDGLGGGVCQTATTMNCAVRDAIKNGYALEVLEANVHGLPVSYVNDTELEAMINWGTSDFRFINNTGKAIGLSVFSDEQSVTAEVYIMNF